MLLRKRQKELVTKSVTALREHQNTLAVAPTGCHAKGTKILMYDGSVKNVEDIRIGDVLMGTQSQPRHVLECHTGHEDMVKVRPIKGNPFIVNKGHILTLVRVNEGKSGIHAHDLVDISVSDVMAASKSFRHLHKLIRMGCVFPDRQEPILEPYMAGVLIGDGSLINGAAVTTPDAEIVEEIHEFAQRHQLSIRTEQIPNNEANTYHFTFGNKRHNPLCEKLRELGLFGKKSSEKFIPDDYKLGSYETRMQMLAGLLDTDGHYQKGGFEWTSSSQQLADDFVFLCRSLGYAAYGREKYVNGKIYYRVHISGNCHLIPTKVVRKQAPQRKQKKDVLRTGFTLHPLGKDTYYGFTVDGDHRYLMGDFTVTHNSGKTIMLSSVIGQMYQNPIHKACVLAHRDELTSQNEAKFKRVNPHISTSIYDASSKSWDGAVIFAMVQTLSRQANLDTMPKLDALIIDEAHHAAANSYGRVIEQIKDNNPEVLIFGVTATPNRGDKKGLRPVFSNVADQITVKELIQSGHLVKPRTMVMDLGLQNDLRNVRKTMSDFDMNAVADIMNRRPINEAVVKHWRDHAEDRQTVIFCSTVQHAHDVCEAFVEAGYKAATIWGDMSDADRRETLSDFTSGKIQILVNVAVLTEGFDHPPTSCVILLRPSSFKSTMIQMIGRGLRIVDPKEHPNIVKKDCIILDFGTSTLIHGSLEDEANLDGREGNNEAPYKECPDCGADVPISVRECALCGYEWPEREPEEAMPVSDFVMSEIDLLKRSNFEWIDIKNNGACYMASGFEAWGCVLFKNGDWVAVGGHKSQPAQPLARGDKQICLAAADDWLNSHETESAAHKTRGWLNQSPTDKQMQYLPDYQHDYSLTRYKASVLMTAKFNRNAILKAVRT